MAKTTGPPSQPHGQRWLDYPQRLCQGLLLNVAAGQPPLTSRRDPGVTVDNGNALVTGEPLEIEARNQAMARAEIEVRIARQWRDMRGRNVLKGWPGVHCSPAHIGQVGAGVLLKRLHTLVSHVHLPVLLARPESNGSTDPSRRCQGCSHPVHNDEPKPRIWTATAESTLTKVRRGRVALSHTVSQ
jgi:hypothetical protein